MDAVSERKVLGRIYGNLAVWIPACAGETSPSAIPAPALRVHPRVRGGDVSNRAARCSSMGPSPRARGRRRVAEGEATIERSIPACAGETAPPRETNRPSRVHPRVRGGDFSSSAGIASACGPSPRARGRHAGRLIRWDGDRSIPACAGETDEERQQESGIEVHPRVRGGDIPEKSGMIPE